MVDRLSNIPDIIKEFLSKLGMSTDEITIFISLHEQGDSTVLKLSKRVFIPRSTLYRILEKMKTKGYITELIEEYHSLYHAAEFSHLELLIQKEEDKMSRIKQLFPMVDTFFQTNTMLIQPSTKVYFYKGVEGIRQMVWNVLKTKDEIVGYSYRLLDEFIGEKFMNSWREEFLLRKLKGRDIYADSYLESLKMLKKKDQLQFPGWTSRVTNNTDLDIDHQIDIYNDVLGIYNWHEGEVFGVEIHNKKVAKLQRQIFEIVWNQAQPEEVFLKK